MRISRMMSVGLVLAALAMTGCKNSLKQEKAMLEEENANLRTQLADRNKALEDTNAEKRALEQQLAAARREGDKGAAPAGGNGGANPFGGIEGVTGSMSAGEVTASVESDLLFDSGKTTLKPSAKKSLDAVANVIKSQYAGKSVRVVGYTDTDPIRKSGFKSNYHLGFERAFEVRKYLVSKGLTEKQVSLASYGPDMPKSTKPQSRRVEVVVLLNQ